MDNLSGLLTGELACQAWLGVAALIFILGFLGAPFIFWSILLLAILFGLNAPIIVIGLAAAVCLIFLIKPIQIGRAHV